MRIGIDISQIVYEGTGVSTYVRKMVEALLTYDSKNTYVLFGASLRRRSKLIEFMQTLKQKGLQFTYTFYPLPLSFLDFLWNRLHLIPIEWFIGKVDVFWSSDWTQPPLARACGVTTIHDVSFLRFPESFHKKIIAVHKRKLRYALRQCKSIFCDSECTKRDILEYYHVNPNLLHVIYPGFTPII